MLIYILSIKYADVAELADALVLGTSTSVWGFKSLHPHQSKKREVFKPLFFIDFNAVLMQLTTKLSYFFLNI